MLLLCCLNPRRDFLAFVRAAEKYGRTELDKIAGEVEGKSREEVVAYSQVRVA
jgi:SWI/SNF-related matrix-associated actin-dependent regulator of chromatin subfamily A member 5